MRILYAHDIRVSSHPPPPHTPHLKLFPSCSLSTAFEIFSVQPSATTLLPLLLLELLLLELLLLLLVVAPRRGRPRVV